MRLGLADRLPPVVRSVAPTRESRHRLSDSCAHAIAAPKLAKADKTPLSAKGGFGAQSKGGPAVSLLAQGRVLRELS
jgi:hypothetical protein